MSDTRDIKQSRFISSLCSLHRKFSFCWFTLAANSSSLYHSLFLLSFTVQAVFSLLSLHIDNVMLLFRSIFIIVIPLVPRPLLADFLVHSLASNSHHSVTIS